MKKKVCVISGGILLVISIVFAYMFVNQERFCQMTSFKNRVLSSASADNIDISKLTFFYSGFLICLFASFGFFSTLITKEKRENIKSYFVEEFKKLKINKLNNSLLKLLLFSLLLLYLFYQIVWVSVTPAIVELTFSLCVGAVRGHNTFRRYIERAVRVFAAVYMFRTVLLMCALFAFRCMISEPIVSMFMLVLTCLLYWNYDKKEKLLYNIGFIEAGVGVFICLAIEICFSLRVRGGATTMFPVVILGSCVLGVVLLLLFLVRLHSKNDSGNGIEQKLWNEYYFLNIFSMSWLMAIREVKVVNFFESANHGMSISQFIHFGEFPIIDNFDAHMFSNWFPGILYYFVNGDFEGALKTPYAYIYSVILVICIYKILCRIIGGEASFLLMLFFPINKIVAASVALPNDATFMVGIFMLLAFLWWREKSGILNHLILWLLAAISVLIQFDTGMAFGMTAIILAFIFLLSQKKKKELITFGLVGVFLAIVGMGIIYLMLGKGRSLLEWIKQFLNISLSNQNWALPTLSTGDKLGMYIFYVIIFFAIVWFAIRWFGTKSQNSAILSFIMVAFLMNSSRTVVRHTIHENGIYVTGFMTLGLMLLIAMVISSLLEYHADYKTGFGDCAKLDDTFKKISLLEVKMKKGNDHSKKEKQDFTINVDGLLKLMIISSVVIYLGTAFSSNFLVSLGVYSEKTEKALYDGSVEESDEADRKKIIMELNDVLNKTLQNDETYYDFSNYTNLYSFVKRNNPVYENQSPALVNGEKGQQGVVSALKDQKQKVPFVLMSVSMSGLGKSLDGILNVDRYYLIAEYIYDQYQPFYKSDDLEIWCLKERFDEMKKKLQNGTDELEPSFSDSMHLLGYIPYIWANYDSIKTQDYEKRTLQDILVEKVAHEEGDYLLLNIDSSSRSDSFAIEIQYENETTEKYYLSVLEGVHDYKIRVSTDYDWYRSEVVGINTINDEMIRHIDYYFCKADTLDK